MRIGLFGGTFNPVHNGHIEAARHVLKEFNLDKIVFIPAKIPVHKNLEYETSSLDRLEMIQIAIENISNFEVSSIEIDREEKSYSYLTIKTISELYSNDNLFFILGTDSFNSIKSWKYPEKLIELTDFIVMRRPGDEINKKLAKWIKNVYLSRNELLDISSTDIRKRIDDEAFIETVVDPKVLNYIKKRRLYSSV